MIKDQVLLPVDMKPNSYGPGIKGYDMQLVHNVVAVQGPGRLAMALVEKWGLVAGEIDGEDSAGRSKLRRLTPDELVKDACDTAESLWNELEARGWLLQVPLPTKAPVKKAEEEEA